MFELARLVGTPRREIILQTRVGHSVPNSQSCEPDEKTKTLYDLFRKQHPFWKPRKAACGIYNCAGLAWANRRTSIYDENAYSKIIKDDGYRPIATEEQLQPGDIVIYLRPTIDNLRNTLHVGIVLISDEIGEIKIHWVLSKWSDQYGEDIHKIRDIPSYFGEYLVELWTDKTEGD